QVDAVCEGGAITLETTSLNGITGTWSPAINNTATTEYTVTPDEGQCAEPVTMTVEVTELPTIELEAVQPTCEEATGTITVTSATTGLEYSIDGTTFAPYSANGWSGLAPGDYTITVRNDDGCEASADSTIEYVPGLPVIEVEAVQPTCEEATGAITVTSATTGLEYRTEESTVAPECRDGWTRPGAVT